MKKLFFAVLAALLVLCSCQMDELAGHVEEDVLYVKIEESSVTKTYMGAGNKVLWSEGDQIAAFMKSYEAAKYQVSGESVGNSSAVFTKVSGSGSSGNSAPQHNVAFYPYSFVSSLSKSGNNYVADVNVPAVQTYSSESFDDGFFPMAAVSKDNTLSFRNIYGAVNLRLTGSQKVKSVSLSGNSGEKISGAGTVTVYPDNSAPYLKLKSSASSSVTLDCGDGVQLNESQATSFVIILPPVGFSKGFTMTVTDSEGTEYEIRTDKSNSISRSNIHAVPVLKLGDDFGGDPDAPVYIDEYGVNHGPGIDVNGVVWAPVNCGYHKTDFKYGKLYQWGRKYGHGHEGPVYDINGKTIGNYISSELPVLEIGPVCLSEGLDTENARKFYTSDSFPLNWCSNFFYNLWNSGTEDMPVKTEYDPCPEGWRVPTYAELESLTKCSFSRIENSDGMVGYMISGAGSSTSKSPQLFLPSAGARWAGGKSGNIGLSGTYTSSKAYSWYMYSFNFSSSKPRVDRGNLGGGYSIRCVRDDSKMISVNSISLDKSSLTLTSGEYAQLSATLIPSDSNKQSLQWWSDDKSVAIVDQNGRVRAMAEGHAIITAMAGMKIAACTVTVNGTFEIKNYVDEYGVDHGPGVKIGETVWAPVNCGYKASTADSKGFTYGKLYQWGRRYGQGYSTYYDESIPETKNGPIPIASGQDYKYANVYFKCTESPYDWASARDDKLWNAGTEEYPVKAEYDPCPEGWRVPTYSELSELSNNRSPWYTNESGQRGYWFCGREEYSETVPQVFFPAAGHVGYTVETGSFGTGSTRDRYGYYWSSSASDKPEGVLIDSNWISLGGLEERSDACSVRCVQE